MNVEVPFLYNKVREDGLYQNQLSIHRWKTLMTDYEGVIERLRTFRAELKVPIMIPIGNKAFMPGKLVHTNEVLACLGDGWFVKDSAERCIAMCERRIRDCKEQLDKLHKEQRLLESRNEFLGKQGLFQDDGQQEIVEQYDEEQEKAWRLEHRRKEKEYRQKLAQVKKTQESIKVEKEDDVLALLDALELQEELQDEMDRLGVDDESTSDNSSASSSSSDDDDIIRIKFTHSNNPGTLPSTTGQIISPADINPAKPTKKVSFATELTEVRTISPCRPQKPVSDEPAVSDSVVERTITKSEISSSASRPVSKFKAARKK